MDITDFKCSYCNVEFAPDEGGTCHSCDKLFCINHLYERDEDGKKIYICKNCGGTKKIKGDGMNLPRIRNILNKFKQNDNEDL